MKNPFAYFALGLALSASGLSASAQIGDLGNSPSTPVQNIFCEKNLKATVTRISKSELPGGYSDLKDVQLNSDFRFPKNDLPFSEALSLNDPVTGQSVAVLDQNFVPGGSKLFSSWGRFGISLSGYWVYITTSGNATAIPFEADILWIPDGNSFLVVKGCNGRFTVTKEIAIALRNFPAGKNGYIRFSAEGTGSAVLSEVGKGTVQAWKEVYANWAPASPPKIESLGY